MPRGGSKRRKLRQKQPYAHRHVIHPVLDRCSSMTFTPDGGDSSNNGSAHDDYFENMQTQSDGAMLVNDLDTLLMSDVEVVTRLSKLTVCRSQDSSGACSSAISASAPQRKPARARASLRVKRKRHSGSCSETRRKRVRRGSFDSQTCSCVSYTVPESFHVPEGSLDSDLLSSMSRGDDGGHDVSSCPGDSSPMDTRPGSTCSVADCGQESSLSESEGEANCDADDELSCVETSSTGAAAVVSCASWQTRTLGSCGLSSVQLGTGRCDDTPTNSEQELSNLVESALDSLSEAGRRGYQRQVRMAQLRSSGHSRFPPSSKSGSPGSPTITSGTQLNQLIARFVTVESKRRMPLPSLQPYLRQVLLRLVMAYQLKTYSRGDTTVIIKTKHTAVPEENVLSEALAPSKGNSSSPSLESIHSPACGDGCVRFHPTGPPIAESNVGRQMLRSMGWQPGTGLGHGNRGIVEPIAAYRQPGRQGLG